MLTPLVVPLALPMTYVCLAILGAVTGAIGLLDSGPVIHIPKEAWAFITTLGLTGMGGLSWWMFKRPNEERNELRVSVKNWRENTKALEERLDGMEARQAREHVECLEALDEKERQIILLQTLSSQREQARALLKLEMDSRISTLTGEVARLQAQITHTDNKVRENELAIAVHHGELIDAVSDERIQPKEGERHA